MRRLCLLICFSLLSSLIHAAVMPIAGLENSAKQKMAMTDLGHVSSHSSSYQLAHTDENVQSSHSNKSHAGCDLCIAAIPHQPDSHSLGSIPNGAPFGMSLLKESAPSQQLAKPPVS